MEIFTERNARVVTIVFCGLLFVLGFLVVIPIGLTLNSTGGNCLLYADRSSYGSFSLCTYPIAVAAIFQLVYCLVRIVVVVTAMRGILKDEFASHKIILIVCTIVDGIVCFLTLVSVCVISHGFNVMCSEVFNPHSEKCGDIDIYMPATNSFLKHYFSRLSIAEVGGWLGWLCWIVLVVVDVFRLWNADIVSKSSLPFSLPSWPIKGCRDPTESDNDSSKGRSRSGTGDSARAQRYCYSISPSVPESSPSPPAQGPGYKLEGSHQLLPYPTSVSVSTTRFNFSTAAGGTRTPPPSRPVPPRPGYNAGSPAQ